MSIIALAVVILIGGCTKAPVSKNLEQVVVLANGNILTMNPDQPSASAMAVKGGRILEVGDLAKVKKAAGESYEYVDLEGATVVPGFIETHAHLINYGATLGFLDITSFVCPTLKEALKKLKAQGKPDENGWMLMPENRLLVAYTRS